MGISSVALSPGQSEAVHLFPCGMPLSLGRQILRSWGRLNTKNMQLYNPHSRQGQGCFFLSPLCVGPTQRPVQWVTHSLMELSPS
jgi:hypothetical protein